MFNPNQQLDSTHGSRLSILADTNLKIYHLGMVPLIQELYGFYWYAFAPILGSSVDCWFNPSNSVVQSTRDGEKLNSLWVLLCCAALSERLLTTSLGSISSGIFIVMARYGQSPVGNVTNDSQHQEGQEEDNDGFYRVAKFVRS